MVQDAQTGQWRDIKDVLPHAECVFMATDVLIKFKDRSGIASTTKFAVVGVPGPGARKRKQNIFNKDVFSVCLSVIQSQQLSNK